ncbi:hypothetical protein DB30_02858 [Enhygromyxa salina]|uniref:Uncharacterized protein n=1 Tax=Enhygromyxa salina TaxID=215803 RepID=A0A0C2CUY6_9BACT|nr:hypothetical protein DB30_02858 [Enhygromyxa salina]
MLYREKFIQASLDADMIELAFAIFVDTARVFPGMHSMLDTILTVARDSPFRISLYEALHQAGEEFDASLESVTIDDLDAFVIGGPDCRLNDALELRRGWRWIEALNDMMQVAANENGSQAAFALSNAAFIHAMLGNFAYAGELASVYLSMVADSSGQPQDFHPMISFYNPSFQHICASPLPRIATALERASVEGKPAHRQALRTLAAECTEYAELITAAREAGG